MCSSNARKSRVAVSAVAEHVFGLPRAEEETASLAAIIPLTTIELVIL